MSIINISSPVETVADVRNEVAETAATFVVDCRLSDQDLTAEAWVLALEYAYRPLPRFWRNIDLEEVIKAVALRYPDWESAMEAAGTTANDILYEVDFAIVINGFHEAMAEMMMKLPKAHRPRASDAASQWICAELEKIERVAQLLYAQQPEVKCGERALLLMTCLEEVESGNEMVLPETQKARAYRIERMEEA